MFYWKMKVNFAFDFEVCPGIFLYKANILHSPLPNKQTKPRENSPLSENHAPGRCREWILWARAHRKGSWSPACETHVNGPFLEKCPPRPTTPLLQTYSQMYRQHRHVGAPERRLHIRKTKSPWANTCFLSLPAPVPGTQFDEISVLFREHLFSLLRKQGKTHICYLCFNFFFR